jgi:hypothetical protein
MSELFSHPVWYTKIIFLKTKQLFIVFSFSEEGYYQILQLFVPKVTYIC